MHPNSLSTGYHAPVMLRESIEALNVDPQGTYVDATFGGGGHSCEILNRISNGKLFAFDQDEESALEADRIRHPSFIFFQTDFRHMKKYLKLHGVTQVDGVLADLGISSHQIDTAVRGFSTRFDGPLDMRMRKTMQRTAADIVNQASEEELHKILGIYGELRNARTAAHAIVQARTRRRIETTAHLIAAIEPNAPRGKENKYFAQAFQALRIVVNDEISALEFFLRQCGEIIRPKGRLVVIAYHSMEDRPVKNYINTGNMQGQIEKDFYGNRIAPFKPIFRKPIIPSTKEIEVNKRARSAKLRAAIKS